MRVLIGVLVLILCAWRTAERAKCWRSDQALWAAAVTSSPSLPRPALNLAAAYTRISEWEAALLWTLKANELGADQAEVSALVGWIDTNYPICDRSSVRRWCA